MKDFIKRNFVLVLGVTLPLLLILVFAAIKLTAQFVDAPLYKPVFAVQQNFGYSDSFSFSVSEDGTLAVTFEVNPRYQIPSNYEFTASLVIYDPESDSMYMTTLHSPKDIELGKQYSIDLPERFTEMKIIPGEIAPDGYILKPYDRDRGNLFTTLFGYGSYNIGYVLTKDGRKFQITMDGIYYGNLSVIGWVSVDESGK